jgi:hypothetical protein
MTKNKTAKKILVVGELIVLIMAAVLAWFWKSLPPQVPWFYSLPSGEQQLVNKIILVAVLGGAGVSLLVTKMVAKWASLEDSPVEITVMTGGLVAIVLLMAGFFRVIQVIIGL